MMPSAPSRRIGVVISEDAYRAFSHVVCEAAPDIRWWLIGNDGTARERADGQVCAVASAVGAADVVWLSNDLFRSGALESVLAAIRTCTKPLWVQSSASGVDGPLGDALGNPSVRVTVTHATAIPIAEYVLRCVLDHYQQPELWREAAREKQWAHRDFREVSGSSWLVIGVGAIGREVALRARAMGAFVRGVRRRPDGNEPVDEIIHAEDVLDHVGDSDVVVLAVPATKDTVRLVDSNFLERMGPGSMLINVARGSVVDEQDLLDALDCRRIEHAYLDVADTEPAPLDSRLWDHPRVTLTPHNSGGGTGRYLRAAELFADNLRTFVMDPSRPLANELVV